MLPETKRDIEVSEEISSRLITHLRDDTTDLADSDLFVPVEHFVSVERAAEELRLLETLPLMVAHCSELTKPGDFVTREVLGKPLLIVRQEDGSAQAYLNMCRHRGGRVEPRASGSKRIFMCQYHGWSYDRDGGQLRNVPYEESFESIDRKCNSLIAFRTDERHGLVFVNFSDNQRESIADYLGPDVDAQMAPWRMHESVVFIEKTFTLDINWKLVMDGASDIIHPRFLHPGGVGNLIESNVGVFRDYGRHGQHFGVRSKLKTLVKSNAEISSGSKYIASNLIIYPNAMMIAAPEHIEFWTVWPEPGNPSRSTVHLRFLVRKDIVSPEIEARVHKSWAVLENAAANEDWPMELWIQQNAQAWPRGAFRYGRSELACAHLHRQLRRDLDGATA